MDDIDAAISRVNSGRYGSQASLFTSNGASARKFRSETEVGNVESNVGVAGRVRVLPGGEGGGGAVAEGLGRKRSKAAGETRNFRRSVSVPSGMRLTTAVALCAIPVWGAGFEVASVRPNRSDEGGRQGGLFREHIHASEGRVTLRNVSLQACIKWAYGVQDPQVVGPDWLKTERYDIAAKASGPATEDELREMLRVLLVERFGLRVRRDTRRMSAASLTVSGETKLTASEGAAGTIRAERGKIFASRTTMGELAGLLSDPLRMPVVDETGLAGRYDFVLDFTGYNAGDGEMAATTGALRAIGLKVEARKSEIDVIVVEHAEKVPLEN